jgi:hypothetical protein
MLCRFFIGNVVVVVFVEKKNVIIFHFDEIVDVDNYGGNGWVEMGFKKLSFCLMLKKNEIYVLCSNYFFL